MNIDLSKEMIKALQDEGIVVIEIENEMLQDVRVGEIVNVNNLQVIVAQIRDSEVIDGYAELVLENMAL